MVQSHRTAPIVVGRLRESPRSDRVLKQLAALCLRCKIVLQMGELRVLNKLTRALRVRSSANVHILNPKRTIELARTTRNPIRSYINKITTDLLLGPTVHHQMVVVEIRKKIPRTRSPTAILLPAASKSTIPNNHT